MSAEKEFFIGWEERVPGGLRRSLIGRVVTLACLALLVAVLTAAFQTTPGSGRFAFGSVETYSGILLSEPVPMLIVDEAIEGQTILLLVNQLKHGVHETEVVPFHLQRVSLAGTLIHDDQGAMIELVPEGITVLEEPGSATVPALSEGELVTLVGEIVDSKCYLGVMNPGRLKPHRACAIQCLKGGIPPVLVAESHDGAVAQYVIVGSDGESINRQILEYVAEPIELSGQLKLLGDRRILFADLESLRRR